ncbi:TadE/TadG family type IV pilus assembly protein [Paramylibacter kogurei]|nr:pilus assembly protein TadG-related protein [Amylibacter kogurei]
MMLSYLYQSVINRKNKFAADEEGTLTLFAIITFVVMVALAGIAVDVARFEAARTKTQITIDNAALAAASLFQATDPDTVERDADGNVTFKGTTYTPEQIVDFYMAKADLPHNFQYEVNTPINVSNAREVDVTTKQGMDTVFLHMMGQKDMNIGAYTSALEGNPLSEVSLVLDISGSMRGTQKLGNLVSAAQTFVGNILAANSSQYPNMVSMSLVPYSAYVNVGENLLNAMDDTILPSVANNMLDANPNTCLELRDSTFNSVGIPQNTHFQTEYEKHITFGYYDYTNQGYGETDKAVRTPYCPAFDWAQITPVSKNEAALKAQLAKFEATTNTSIDDGVKWGAALLDRSMQPTIKKLTQLNSWDSQYVDPAFEDRPLANGTRSNKILVVMTDGINTEQRRLKDQYETNGSDANVYWKKSDGYHYFRNSNRWGYEELSWRELFGIRTIYNHVRDRNFGGSTWGFMEAFKTGSQKDTRLNNICTAAKSAGITIYTITYEATVDSAKVMANCSSGPTYAYTATSSDIDSIFNNISIGIKKLQLTN